MDNTNNSDRRSEQRLEQQLARLREIDGVDSVQRVKQSLQHTMQAERRQVAWSLIGAAVAAVATLVFVYRDDPLVYIALTAATAVMLATAWRCSGRATGLLTLNDDWSLVTAWRVEFKRQSRATLIAGPTVAALFSILTVWVFWRHGFAISSIVYLGVAVTIWSFVVYHLLVTWPILKRQRNLIDAASLELDDG